jgi:uncharacterized protein YcfJ
VEVLGLDIEAPLEVSTRLVLPPVDLAEDEHAIANDAPGLVGGVVADDLGGDHRRQDVETVATQATGGREAVLEAREQVERAERDRRVEVGRMEGVGDESSKVWRGWWLPCKFSGFGPKI